MNQAALKNLLDIKERYGFVMHRDASVTARCMNKQCPFIGNVARLETMNRCAAPVHVATGADGRCTTWAALNEEEA